MCEKPCTCISQINVPRLKKHHDQKWCQRRPPLSGIISLLNVRYEFPSISNRAVVSNVRHLNSLNTGSIYLIFWVFGSRCFFYEKLKSDRPW